MKLNSASNIACAVIAATVGVFVVYGFMRRRRIPREEADVVATLPLGIDLSLQNCLEAEPRTAPQTQSISTTMTTSKIDKDVEPIFVNPSLDEDNDRTTCCGLGSTGSKSLSSEEMPADHTATEAAHPALPINKEPPVVSRTVPLPPLTDLVGMFVANVRSAMQAEDQIRAIVPVAQSDPRVCSPTCSLLYY